MSEFDYETLKSVALKKNLQEPEADSSMILEKRMVDISKSVSKATSVADLHPTDKELALINKLAILPQKADRWLMLRNVNPIGVGSDVDSDGDIFEKGAEQDLVDQAFNTPLLTDHAHDIAGTPPVGMCVLSKMTANGPRETIAIPIELYNENMIKGLMSGQLNKISVGMLVNAACKICVACNRSIYSTLCPHEKGEIDSSGNRLQVRITRVERYLERSLVNVPARLGTSTKALNSMDDLDKYFTAMKGGDPFDAITNNTVVEQGGPNTSVHVYDGESISEALGGAVIPSERKEKSHIDTIETVNKTIEGSIVADKAQEETKELDTKAAVDKTAEEAKAAEDTSKAAEEVKSADDKSAEDKSADEKAAEEKAMEDEKAKKPADDGDADDKSAEAKSEEKATETKAEEKSLDVEALNKSVATLEASTKKFLDASEKAVGFEATVKSLVETNKAQGETIQKLLDGAASVNKHMEAQNDRIEKLLGLQEELAKSVKEAMEVSSLNTMEQLSELINTASEMSADNKSANLDLKNSDWTKSLLSFNQTNK